MSRGQFKMNAWSLQGQCWTVIKPFIHFWPQGHFSDGGLSGMCLCLHSKPVLLLESNQPWGGKSMRLLAPIIDHFPIAARHAVFHSLLV